ncbi:cytochrome P450 [Bradyrhizobium sp. CW7]|uniref:cytochrome P450 family protein n=1 Tax=Bradyrhizobium sp. CW7 TaxID=2782688 RepID=UPI001FFB005F|nr:cytochrome P450 [Bradyrhizobium sp. CW7]MCK1351369.1 cytochrome P450 [Bradyrhizobium sp. CW7]
MNQVNGLQEHGELIDVPNFEAMLNPHPLYAELAARGPVVRLRTHLGVEVYGITQWNTAVAVLRDIRFSKSSINMQEALKKSGLSGPGSGFPISGAKSGNLLNTDPPDHTRLRNLVNMAFSPRRIELLRLRVEALVDDLLSRLVGREDADMIGEFAYPIGITMICELLGVPDDSRSNFRDWATKAMSPGHTDQQQSLNLLMQYLADLIAAKRKLVDDGAAPDAQPDVLSAMIAARLTNDALTEDELVSMSYLMLIAGHETTVGLIGNALLQLMQHPEQMTQLTGQPELIKQAIDEVLRYDGPVHRTTMRATAEDVEIGGLTIPRGSFVQVLVAGCNRDAVRFPDPDRFDISRKPSQNLAFGYGAHFCLGLHLARLEAQTAITRALKAHPGMRLACSPEDIPWAKTVIRAPARLPVRFGR